MPPPPAGREPVPPPMPVVALGALYGSNADACFSWSLVMESLSLSASFFDLSPGTIWNALGASATSFAPMPRKPPTPITKAWILPSLSNRMSLTSPIFSFSLPTTSVPLKFDARNWSERCELTNFAEPSPGFAAADELGAGELISGDLAGGVAGGDDCAAGGLGALGAGGVPSATAAPIRRPVNAVETISFFNMEILLGVDSD